MKLWDIIKSVGAGVIKNTVPGGGLLIAAVNELMPSDNKLPINATGDDINRAVESLPDDQRAALLDKEFDVDITQIKESNSTVRAMLDADVLNPQTTRPWIAKWAFIVAALIHIVVVGLWAVAVSNGDKDTIKSVMSGWPFIVAMTGPFVTLLLAYFGTLKREQKNRFDAANGTQSGIVNFISSVFRK